MFSVYKVSHQVASSKRATHQDQELTKQLLVIRWTFHDIPQNYPVAPHVSVVQMEVAAQLIRSSWMTWLTWY